MDLQLNHRARQQFQNAKKRASDYKVINCLTLLEWCGILFLSQGFCFYCERDCGFENLTLEHKIPLVKGGANSASNIVAACETCNYSKKDGIIPRVIADMFFDLKFLRRAAGLSKVQMAKMCETKPYMIELWESGKKEIPPEVYNFYQFYRG